jgi:hypothetical protein
MMCFEIGPGVAPIGAVTSPAVRLSPNASNRVRDRRAVRPALTAPPVVGPDGEPPHATAITAVPTANSTRLGMEAAK